MPNFGTFSRPSSNRTASKCLSHNNPVNGCPYKIRSRGTSRSSMFAQDFVHLCRGKTYPYVWTFWLRNFEQSGRILHFYIGRGRYCTSCLSVTICQSCNNIHLNCVGSRVVVDNVKDDSGACTTLPLYFCNFGSSSAFFEVIYVQQCSKVDFHVSLCASRITIFLALDILQLWCWDCLEIFPYLVHCNFCIRHVHR